MDHGQGVQDHLDALRRARNGYSSAWEPILAAVEIEPGVWHMVGAFGQVYAIVRIIEVGGERGYRATTWAQESQDRRLIGYYRTLRRATREAHMAFVRSHGQTGAANGIW